MGTGSVRWGEHSTGYSRALSAGSWEAAAEWDGVFVAALKWKLKTSVHIEMAVCISTHGLGKSLEVPTLEPGVRGVFSAPHPHCPVPVLLTF